MAMLCLFLCLLQQTGASAAASQPGKVSTHQSTASRPDVVSDEQVVTWLQQLCEPNQRRARMERAAAGLRLAGMRSLRMLRDQHARLREPLEAYTEQVLPYLPREAARDFLLKEWRQYRDTYHRWSKPIASASQDSLRQAALAGEDVWWCSWVVQAMLVVPPDASVYDEVLAAYRTMDSEPLLRSSRPAEAFYYARVLQAIDAKRAAEDFSGMITSQDPAERIRGIRGLHAIGVLPGEAAVKGLLADRDERVRYDARLLIDQLRREDLDLLIDLVGSRWEGHSWSAQERLRTLGYVSKKHVKEVMGEAKSPAQRAAAWRAWWQERRGLSDSELREQGVRVILADGRWQMDAKDTRGLMDSLNELYTQYPDDPGLYDLLQALPKAEMPNMLYLAVGRLGMLAKNSRKATDVLIEFLQTGDERLVEEAGRALVETGDPRAVPTLVAAKERFSGSERMRQILIGLLDSAGDPTLLDRFVRWIVEDGQESAARGLVELDGASAAVPRLVEALEQSSNEKQVSAASTALMMMEDRAIGPQVVPVLERLTSRSTVAEARLVPVVRLAWKYPEAGNRAALLRLLKREDVRVREAAVEALAAMHDSAAIDAVVELAGYQGREEVQLGRLAHALWDMRSPQVRDRLVEVFRKATGPTWQRLAIVLAEQRDPELVEVFADFLDDENREVRGMAAEGIAQVMRPHVDKPMREGQWDESYIGPVRRVLCWMLRNEKLRPDDWLIAEELLPRKKKLVVLEVAGTEPVRHLLFNVGGGTLEVRPAEEAAKWAKVAWAGMGPAGTGDYAGGQLMCREGQGFLLVRVMMPTLGVHSKDNGLGIYLFRKAKEGFVPVAPLTGRMRPDPGQRGGDRSSVVGG